MVDFLSIPTGLRVPGVYVEFDSSRSAQGLPVMPQKILVLGQKLATGTASALTPVVVNSAAEAKTLFGQGSQLARMFVGLKAANTLTETWAIPVADDDAGVAATKTITLTGPATAAGTLATLIAGTRVAVAVAPAATATVVATALAAAINAAGDLPVTAAANAGVVTLTARNKGENGNDIDVRVNYRQGEVTPAGLTVAIATGAAGSGNPSVAAALAAIGATWFNTWVVAWSDDANLDLIDTDLAERWGPLHPVDALAFVGVGGTQGALATLGAARNGPHVSLIGGKRVPTSPCELAAIYGGVAAYYGGIDPNRPLQTLALPTVLPPATVDQFSLAERDALLHDGISTFTVDSGGAVLIERSITTYQTNAQGVEDTAYLDVEPRRLLSYLRYSLRARISTRYPRHKLADDDTPIAAGQAVMTPSVMRAEIVALAMEWNEAGYVEDIERFKAELIVERDPSDPNQLNARIPTNLINGFRKFAGQIQFII